MQEAFAAFSDVDSSQLHHQLRLLKTLFKDSDNSTVTTTTVAKTMVSLPPITQDLLIRGTKIMPEHASLRCQL